MISFGMRYGDWRFELGRYGAFRESVIAIERASLKLIILPIIRGLWHNTISLVIVDMQVSVRCGMRPCRLLPNLYQLHNMTGPCCYVAVVQMMLSNEWVNGLRFSC
jgi:hypothetical protein